MSQRKTEGLIESVAGADYPAKESLTESEGRVFNLGRAAGRKEVLELVNQYERRLYVDKCPLSEWICKKMETEQRLSEQGEGKGK